MSLAWAIVSVFATKVKAQVNTQDSVWNGYRFSYYLPSLPGWGEERFPIPIGFAPSIPLKGVEDLRFSPDWAKPQSQQYWTYAFLWYLDGSPKITKDSLARYLTAYYSGLYYANTQGDSIRLLDQVAVTAKINTVPASKGMEASFLGDIRMNDYMQRKPITLRVKIHMRNCPNGKTALFFQLSPRPFSDEIWKSLDQIWKDFSCNDGAGK